MYKEEKKSKKERTCAGRDDVPPDAPSVARNDDALDCEDGEPADVRDASCAYRARVAPAQ